MAIPNLNLNYEVRGKVRIGKKNQKGYASSVDHFLSSDPEVQGEPKTLRIVLPHADVEPNFSTGLEWWVQTKEKKNQLACYTKDSGSEPVALRLAPYVREDNVAVGEQLKQGRIPIRCPFRTCPEFKAGKCKPMGRLVFFIQGGRTDAVLQLDTKGWNSIEALTATLTGARMQGPLTGRVFDLSVAFENKGTSRFPVLSLTEVSEVLNTDKDAGYADALIAYQHACESVPEGEVVDARVALAAMLDHTNPGWRDNPAFIDRIKEVGPETALDTLLERVRGVIDQ